jgi:hypothetical protein
MAHSFQQGRPGAPPTAPTAIHRDSTTTPMALEPDMRQRSALLEYCHSTCLRPCRPMLLVVPRGAVDGGDTHSSSTIPPSPQMPPGLFTQPHGSMRWVAPAEGPAVTPHPHPRIHHTRDSPQSKTPQTGAPASLIHCSRSHNNSATRHYKHVPRPTPASPARWHAATAVAGVSREPTQRLEAAVPPAVPPHMFGGSRPGGTCLRGG